MFKNFGKKLKKDQRGLTLVEILAVVVILAIVAAIAFVVIGKVIDNSKKDAQIANAQQIISGVKLAESTGDVKPEDVVTGITILGTNPTPDTLGKPVNPWTKTEYTAATVSKTADNVYSITLASPNSECDVDNTEAELQEGRSTVCP